MSTHYHSQFWATQLTLKGPVGTLGQLSRSISNARVDLNPHQVDAALFAVRSPLSKGAVLADEVGLGKTIEAGLVIAQRWAERRRRILIIVPATLRKQWAAEINEKFHIPTTVLETALFKRLKHTGSLNPFEQDDLVVICSYHFAANKAAYVARVPWDLVVIDEAHRLRNVYKTGNKMARTLREVLASPSKLLLTATPLQNSLMELFGLVSFIDEHVFGDEPSFREQFLRARAEETRNLELRRRLTAICHRTLRRQVLEYIRFTRRIPITWDFYPTSDEQQLYQEVSAYLQRETLFALPSAQRKLMTMVLRKLLASSSFAIAGTLRSLLLRLEAQLAGARDAGEAGAESDFDAFEETREEWGDEGTAPPHSSSDIELLQDEIDSLRGYLALAESIEHNAKGAALLDALVAAFEQTTKLGGARKAVVFTESQRTQAYLFDLLERSGFQGEVVILNGSNADDRSKSIYKAWRARHEGEDMVSGSRPVDVKAAITEEFRERASILVATEAAAEGVNFQFCSLVVNYDLPWNPQRIEQRIGRCHRYGQKHDVVVVNFLNRRNAADQRVYELLDEKLHLFDGVFGSSDQVLGALESGVDIERRIAAIYQECRSEEEIAAAFTSLQSELEEQIQDRLEQTRQAVLDNFDEEVHERLRVHRDEARAALDDRERKLLALTEAELTDEAVFERGAPRFTYQPRKAALAAPGIYNLDWRDAEERGDHFYRSDHPLAQALIERAMARELPCRELLFDYAAYGAQIAILEQRLGQSGWLRVDRLRVDSVAEEEHLLVAALCDSPDTETADPDPLPGDWGERLLSVPAKTCGEVNPPAAAKAALEQLLAQEQALRLDELAARNSQHFEEEAEKIDNWAEDLKLTLERDLKELDAEIRAARKESKAQVTLALKLQAQKQIKKLEQRRNQQRRQLFEAQDEIDERRGQLIEEIEKQLQTEATRDMMFTIRWVLPEAVGAAQR
ncbi:MAG: DEAD/DEAH box helicase [Planctomycetota bacterium]|nr:MAG: DEAD/DEAH box helicase [Planctomycetota bacterium]